MSFKKLNRNDKLSNKQIVDKLNALNISLDRFIRSVEVRLNEQEENIKQLIENTYGSKQKEFPTFVVIGWPKDESKECVISRTANGINTIKDFILNEMDTDKYRPSLYVLEEKVLRRMDDDD